MPETIIDIFIFVDFMHLFIFTILKLTIIPLIICVPYLIFLYILATTFQLHTSIFELILIFSVLFFLSF